MASSATLTTFQEKIDPHKKSIWRYSNFFNPGVSSAFQKTLGEGATRIVEGEPPFPGLERLLLKREDLNPNGSHKDRAAAYQISHYLERGDKKVLITSSGNAALSLSAYGRVAGMEVILFVKRETHPLKLYQMSRFSPTLIFTDKPINLARYASKRYGIANLRPSLDDTALEGYKTLAFEIFEEGMDLDSIFMFSTSGSSLMGMGEGFRLLKREGCLEKIPALHCVQSGPIDSISSLFDDPGNPLASASGAPGHLGVKNTARKEELHQLIEESGGWGWWVGDEEIQKASEILSRQGINTSLEGAACLAAMARAARQGKVKKPLLILTGHVSQIPSAGILPPKGLEIPSYNDLRILFDEKYGA